MEIGSIEEIEISHKKVEQVVPRDGSAAIKISGIKKILVGRDFDTNHTLASIVFYLNYINFR